MQDQRLLFKLRRQQAIEMLRSATQEGHRKALGESWCFICKMKHSGWLTMLYASAAKGGHRAQRCCAICHPCITGPVCAQIRLALQCLAYQLHSETL